AVAQNPGHAYNPLFIHGGSGLGKTHLLHAIGQLVANQLPVICTSAEQFTNEFVSALRERKTEDFRSKYRNAGMLLIDDVQFIAGKEQTEECFFHTFNELHNASHQVVLTSDRSPREMPELTERLRSRFEWGLTVDIQPPDHATRLAILEAKAKDREAELTPDVLDVIAGQIQRNIRELEGSLNRVIAYARLLREQPTVEMATQALRSVATQETIETRQNPQLLLSTVAECFQLTPADLTGKARDKETVTARRVAMYILRQSTGCTLSQIGEELGGRDAAAVANACKRVGAEMNHSTYLKDKIEAIRQKIHPAG
ncbi:MAG: chromosomal replication initiator protein DnaA, partial [Dehalococcoidales bacterium]|nr:chromosomal replication initiator protein DnaA [Dehalococcoidales bacterium]